MKYFFVLIARLEAALSAIALFMMACEKLKYSNNTIALSLAGLALWAWVEYDERKVKGK